jgi:hypothetical protein
MSGSLWEIVDQKEGILGFVNIFGRDLEKHLNAQLKHEDRVPRVEIKYSECSPGYMMHWHCKKLKHPDRPFYGQIMIQPVPNFDDYSITVQRWGQVNLNGECSSDELRDAAKVHDSVADLLKEKYGLSEKQNQWGTCYTVSLPKLGKIVV